MPDGITHSNKDVIFKVLSQHYQNKSLAVYGLSIPKIKRLLPADYPAVTATEIHAENPFLLEDGSLLILEYESKPTRSDFLKYNKYVINALERLHKGGIAINNVIIAVIYTGDIKKSATELDVGAVRIKVEQVFLSQFDTNVIYTDLKAKIYAGKPLTDDDILKFIILPLTQPDNTQKQKLIEDTIELAKRVQDEQQQLFVLAGILTATNKFIDRAYSEMVKGWIKMTKVARLFEEEKVEAVNEARNETLKEIAKSLLLEGEDVLKVMKHTRLSRQEVDEILASISA